MKGKTKNHKFISEYISSCSEIGINTPELISKKASDRLEIIDFKIKEIISLKEERSNLLDVIFHFKNNV